jgi:glycosyltransferase involved in cell wall biosynthesis
MLVSNVSDANFAWTTASPDWLANWPRCDAMRVAFYAPLKPLSHPVASGDRAMARLLIAALQRAGHEVEVASTLRSRDGQGDPERQVRLCRIGLRLAERFVRRAHATGRIPSLWFTYHLYDKAPDWIGPHVARRLAIPYVVVEASVAERRRDGRWQQGHAALLEALQQADGVITLNSADRAGLAPYVPRGRHHELRPFLATEPFAAAMRKRRAHRAVLAVRHGLDPEIPWLIAVAMMRPGDKLASYRQLAAALADLGSMRWQLLVIGEGTARPDVTEAFTPCADRVAWLGLLGSDEIAATLAACDLFAWPAINEAYGMALLEGQAAGVAVLAGASGGVPDIVVDGVTGRLTSPGDHAAFCAVLGELVASPPLCRKFGVAAAVRAAALHDISAASRRLDRILRGILEKQRLR